MLYVMSNCELTPLIVTAQREAACSFSFFFSGELWFPISDGSQFYESWLSSF